MLRSGKIGLIVLLAFPVIGGSAQITPQYAYNELIVKFLPQEIDRALELRGEVDIDEIIPLTPDKKNGIMLLTFNPPVDIRETKIALENSDKFIFVEYNYIGYGSGGSSIPVIPNDDFFNRQWGLMNDGSFGLTDAKPDADIDIENAWENTTGSASTIVALLDSGVKLDHPEFSGRIWTNPGEFNDGTDSDGNGKKDDIHGWDFANADDSPGDDFGHGTNIAGIIAANGDNNLGYAGMNWHCQIMPLKVLNHDNTGFYSWWIEAIYYAVENGANVINMSVGGRGYSNALREAIDYAYQNGVTVVTGMMNSNSSAFWYPAAYANTIAVGAVNPDDTRANPFFYDSNSGSNFGDYIDVVAPGNYIYGLSHISDTDFNSYWGGTSQAAGFVTGLVSLLLASDPDLNPADIREILRNSAEDMVGSPGEDTEGWDPYYGYGRINAREALSQVTTAVNDLPSTEGVALYPNPASGDNLNVSFDDHSTRVTGYRLIGTNGTILTRDVVKTSTSEIQLPLHSLQPGSYILLLETTTGQYAARFVRAF